MEQSAYDAVVIGAGHAGCEAALAFAKRGLRTVVFCLSTDHVAFMPCNPHIGGSSKGHLVREIDALGGEMGHAIDRCFLQSRMLNRSKGPAVHSLRAQADKKQYSAHMRRTLEQNPNISLRQAEIAEILTDRGEDGRPYFKGVVTRTGISYPARVCVICSGTYLQARCLTGEVITESGPNGQPSATLLSSALTDIGVKLRRFKTGTPARMDGQSLDFSKMERQEGDVPVIPFSFDTDPEEVQKEQIPCYLTYTNERTHEILRENLHRSPLYAGVIEGVGPRYCPSIEDKVVRFADKDRHQIFVEPEGADTTEMYIDGMSSSMPEDVQISFYRTVPGLEHCEIVKPAYAIEYDCLAPGQLTLSLESRVCKGLFFAGQINGSSGYEEAAAQGLYAAVNATAQVLGGEGLFIDRAEGYIGVLVDDLVHKELWEPYRMMTARAEYRLLLRQDNADLRLREKGFAAGLVSEKQLARARWKKERIAKEMERLKHTRIGATETVREFLEANASAPIRSGTTLAALLSRPELSYEMLSALDTERPAVVSREKATGTDLLDEEVTKQAEIEIKYEGYLSRQEQQVKQFRKMETRRIPADISYLSIKGLRKEAAQHLESFRPENIGAASRIGGVNPADISVLLVYLEAAEGRAKGGMTDGDA